MSGPFDQMHTSLFASVMAETVVLDGQEVQALIERDAEVLLGQVLDRRITAEFRLSDADPHKEAEVRINGVLYRLDLPVGRTDLTVKWALR